MTARTNVLIIEDNQDIAESLRLLFSHQGMAAETAGSLATALARLAERHPPHDSHGVDCVVLDLSLPDGVYGLDAVHRLQSDHPKVPIIVNTGSPEWAVPAIHAGAQDAVIKPGDPEVWKRRIEYAIARHKVRHGYKPYEDALRSAIATVDRMIADDEADERRG